MVPEMIHAFEARGLGRAPYRLIGCVERVGPIPVEGRPGVMVGAPGQAMGVCDFCGTGIKTCFVLMSADGKQFDVGCDCIDKAGDSGLRKQVDPIRKSHERELRHARERARIAEGLSFISAHEAEMRAIPSPRKYWCYGEQCWKYEGRSLWQEWENSWYYCGVTGRLGWIKRLRRQFGEV